MSSQATRPKGLSIISTKIIDPEGNAVRGVWPGYDFVIAITVSAPEPVENVSVGYNIKLANGVAVYGTSSAVQGIFLNLAAKEVKVVRFSFRPTLSLGTYYLSAGAAQVLTP